MTEHATSAVEGPPDADRAFMNDLVRAIRTWRLYGDGHANVDSALARLQYRLDERLESGPLALQLEASAVRIDDAVVHEAESPTDVLPCRLYDHGIVGLEFEPGVPAGELHELVRLVATELDDTTDYPTVLWEADLRAVRVLVDALEDDDAWTTPAGFAEQLAQLGDDDDPPAGEDYGNERASLEAGVAERDFDLDDAQILLGEGDALKLELLRADRGYADTVRHAARVVLSMCGEDLDAAALSGLEHAVGPLVDAACAAGDIDGVREILGQANRMVASARPESIHVATMALSALRRPENIERMLAALERAEEIDAEPLRACLADIGPGAAAPAARWLLETRHPVAALEAVRVLGDALVRALVPLYRSSAAEARERAGSALFDVGTPEALRELAVDFQHFDEARRLRFLQLIERSTEPGLRRLIIAALEDPSAAVRAAAVAAVRKTDAPLLAPVLQAMFELRVFENGGAAEADAFFEMVARVGDATVAQVLATQCLPRGLTRSFKRPGEIVRRCLRALHRMRSPAGRAVVEELARNAPRAIRDALEELRSEADLES